MTRVSIAPPDVEDDVSAEQVAAYLLARGWTDISLLPGSPLWRKFLRDISIVDVPLDQGLVDHGAMMAECIKRIARAEQRHPSAVLADIVGPARAASVGAECYAGSTSFEEAKARFECKARKGLVKWMTECPFPHAGDAWFDAWAQSRGAARRAGEESE